MNEPMIGRLHRAPLLPIRRSLGTGYVGSMSNWTGTPRQITALSEAARDPEARWWFRYTLAFGAGAIAALLVLTR